MSSLFSGLNREELPLLTRKIKSEFLIKLATSPYAKAGWGLIIVSFLVIAGSAGVLLRVNWPMTYLIFFSSFVTLAVILLGGGTYIFWHIVQEPKAKASIAGELEILKQPIMIVDEKDQIVFTNSSFQNQFMDVSKDNVSSFIEKLIDPSEKEEILKDCQKLRENTSSSSKFIINSKGNFKVPWEVHVHSMLTYKKHLLWEFNHLKENKIQEKLSEEVSQPSVDFYRIFDSSPLGIVLLDTQGKFLAANKFFRQQILHNGSLNTGDNFFDLLHENCRQEVANYIQKVIHGETLSLPVEVSFRNHPFQVLSAFIARAENYYTQDNEAQKSTGIILHFVDNTEQKNLHLQLVQSQKLQAMGQLAGGIAHDFNNLLTAMIGFCDLLLLRHSPGNQSFSDIMQIKENASRAANLVKQLLAFSKQQTLQPQILDVVSALNDLSVLLQRLVGVNIVIELSCEPELGLIKVDRGQFEQVIINLAVNARDAMKGKGKLRIKVFNKNSVKPFCINHEALPAGSYVVIEIIDTGTGIHPDHLSRIFDPFFSTKEVGQGTGLGLSTVYGIVQQTGGYIFVDTKLDKGTKFSLFLPSHQPPEQSHANEGIATLQPATGDLNGKGTILFVEDEDAVRLFATRALRDKGYHVVEFCNGEEALKYIRSFTLKGSEKIDLLITDVVMPVLDGPTLVDKAHGIFPDLKVIYISGYAEDSFRQRVDQEDDIQFLSKPFSLKDLSLKVKEVLKESAAVIE